MTVAAEHYKDVVPDDARVAVSRRGSPSGLPLQVLLGWAQVNTEDWASGIASLSLALNLIEEVLKLSVSLLEQEWSFHNYWSRRLKVNLNFLCFFILRGARSLYLDLRLLSSACVRGRLVLSHREVRVRCFVSSLGCWHLTTDLFLGRDGRAWPRREWSAFSEERNPGVLVKVVQVTVIKLFRNLEQTSKDNHVAVVVASGVPTSLHGKLAIRLHFFPLFGHKVETPQIIELVVFVVLSAENEHVMRFLTALGANMLQGGVASTRAGLNIISFFDCLPTIWSEIKSENSVVTFTIDEATKDVHFFVVDNRRMLIQSFGDIWVISFSSQLGNDTPAKRFEVKWVEFRVVSHRVWSAEQVHLALVHNCAVVRNGICKIS